MPQNGAALPRVLVSNDDGIMAPGLQELVAGLCSTQLYDVRVGAPETERSGASHASSGTVTATLMPNGAAVGLPHAVVAYTASGYPADSVRLAFRTDIFEPAWVPEVVVSGMNRGINAGRAVVVSGTVGAAREGALLGAKAISVSLHSVTSSMRNRGDYTAAVQWLLPILNWFIHEKSWPQGILLNINFPAVPETPPPGEPIPKGLMVAQQGRSLLSYNAVGRHVTNADDSKPPGSVTKQYKFRYDFILDPAGTPENDDFIAAINNYVTLTPLPIIAQDDVKSAMDCLYQWRATMVHPFLAWALPN